MRYTIAHMGDGHGDSEPGFGRKQAWGDSGHKLGRLSNAFDKRPPKGDITLIDGRALQIREPRNARQPTIEPVAPSDEQSSPDTPR